jgi:hypothetical protein
MGTTLMSTSTLRITYRIGTRDGVGNLKDKEARGAVIDARHNSDTPKILLGMGGVIREEARLQILRKYLSNQAPTAGLAV